jgi:hypothetical protein
MTDPFLAAGDIQQRAVKGLVPVPGKADFGKAALNAGRWPSRSVLARVPSTSKMIARRAMMNNTRQELRVKD